MKESESLFLTLAEEIAGVTKGKMFGALCMKTAKGKSAAMLWKGDIVVKLPAAEIARTMKLKGACHFEPMKGRPMKEWVQVPPAHSARWKELVKKSLAFVESEK
ncbi:MAG TPA: hypothetical protein VFU15_15050 [Bacteroidia bacterium]|nr:hypothetical protein [Bacteroidia bacterium]